MTVLPAAGGWRARALGRLPVGRRACTAALWFGLLLIFALSSLTTDHIGPAPTQRSWVFGRLNREHTFGQTFIAAPGELIALRMLLFTNPGDRDEPVTLRLRYAEGDLPDLAAVALPLSVLDRRDWTTFEIQPLTLNMTATLRLDVESPTLPPNNWITVMAGPNTYPHGELFVDGAPRPAADLAFQPVYRRRWFDVLLPISHIAQGKPGLLGWPPFYAILAYVCCTLLASMLGRLWCAARATVDAR